MDSTEGEQCASSAIASTSSAATASTTAAGRIKKRRFSSARIQPTRIKKVMQSDEDIGRMVHSVPVALGSVMEHFAKKLLEIAAESVHNSGARTLAPSHIRHAVSGTAAFTFLEPLLNSLSVPAAPASTANSHHHHHRHAQHSQQLPPQLDLKVALPPSLPPSHQLKVPLGRGRKKDPLSAPSGPPAAGVEKRGRGRPRKNAQKAKYIDEEVALEPTDVSNTNNDRLLMPPPRLMPFPIAPAAAMKTESSSPHSAQGNGGGSKNGGAGPQG